MLLSRTCHPVNPKVQETGITLLISYEMGFIALPGAWKLLFLPLPRLWVAIPLQKTPWHSVFFCCSIDLDEANDRWDNHHVEVLQHLVGRCRNPSHCGQPNVGRDHVLPDQAFKDVRVVSMVLRNIGVCTMVSVAG